MSIVFSDEKVGVLDPTVVDVCRVDALEKDDLSSQPNVNDATVLQTRSEKSGLAGHLLDIW